MMFAGLMSRWTTPPLWAASIPCATLTKTSMRSRIDSFAFPSVDPSMYSIARKWHVGWPGCRDGASPTSWTGAMFGWESRAAIFASRLNRATPSWDSPRRNLMAAQRLSLRSHAFHTSPMPPFPRTLTRMYWLSWRLASSTNGRTSGGNSSTEDGATIVGSVWVGSFFVSIHDVGGLIVFLAGSGAGSGVLIVSLMRLLLLLFGETLGDGGDHDRSHQRADDRPDQREGSIPDREHNAPVWEMKPPGDLAAQVRADESQERGREESAELEMKNALRQDPEPRREDQEQQEEDEVSEIHACSLRNC